ncbi:hypothetical protein [Mycobacterium tuberculosis]|nr:hypothetical protein [Mycobacterium tuberculosis]
MRAVGLAAETEAAFALRLVIARLVQPAYETDTALSLAGVQVDVNNRVS